MGGPGVSALEALGGLNTAIELVRAVISAGGAIDKAELKLKLAETMQALAEAKVCVVEVQEELRTAVAEVERLHAALESQGKTARFRDAIYLVDADGKPKGDPYCLSCWETHHLLRSLLGAPTPDASTHCPTCKAKYERRRAPFQLTIEAVG